MILQLMIYIQNQVYIGNIHNVLIISLSYQCLTLYFIYEHVIYIPVTVITHEQTLITVKTDLLFQSIRLVVFSTQHKVWKLLILVA